MAKLSDSQYSKSTNTSYYCNSEANLLGKSLMKLKHRVAYQRKRIPSKRSRFMQKNLKSGKFSQKFFLGKMDKDYLINTMDKHYG